MTLDEFIARLRNSGRAWYLQGGDDRIRTVATDRCPVSAVATDAGFECKRLAFTGPGAFLGLKDSRAIARAADNSPPYYGSRLRRDLLEACNLAPVVIEDEETPTILEPMSLPQTPVGVIA